MADTALVDYDFYTDTYMGEPIAAEDFPRYEARAEDAILIVINKTADEAALLPEAVLTAVKKAICAQIEYLFEYGLSVSVYGKEAGGGFTVGKVSVNNGSSAAGAGARSMIAPAVSTYLERTGLLNPQVDTASEPWLWGWFA
jgi:hypothetical protein